VDELGYTCDNWAADGCSQRYEQYTIRGWHAVLRNCPSTCNRCEDFLNVQAAPPAILQDAFKCEDTPSFCEARYACFDTPDFLDELGYKCSDWYGDCLSVYLEYSRNGLADVMDNCRRSCGLCIPMEKPHLVVPAVILKEHRLCHDAIDYKDAMGHPCEDWVALDCSSAQVKDGYTSQGEDDLLRNCAKSCGVCEMFTWSQDEEAGDDNT
jgi:hypothetical protein